MFLKNLSLSAIFLILGQATVIQGSKGTVYTRWGHNDCPASAKLVYNGVMVGKHYSDVGGGADFLCLPFVPLYDESVVVSGQQTERGRLYHQEYHATTGPFALQLYNDLPCAVCLNDLRSNTMFYPGRNDCPSGWELQYHGYMIGARYTSSTFDSVESVCVDHEGRVVPNTSGSVTGGYIMPVDGMCVSNSAIPCTHYTSDYELTCAICSL
ncbi:uncharacterized protein [Ptychodera flava]|uniref:uncharacterized protein n=1 Tax=Ptychodera flava TaxID=63121 RepID=UPI00396A38E8